ncbi:hypothetical protein L1987_05539 [Smallanthus sonchifolius]|uniref:Uncharacterized protein n=1 Tax=Smallanthus sonchifolius TaxID=185202 RepID=A0ACB9JVN1_9ASTR|nr:hypothetical protein L1987_05539 [Smallanthus sonchifolius]
MSILESNLEGKSRLYKEEALRHLFLMNNIHFMAEKVKGSELRTILGDDWFRERNSKFQQYAMSYERYTWGSTLNELKVEGLLRIDSKTLIIDGLQGFYNGFEEIYKIQTGWSIPNIQLCEDLRISMSVKVILAYRTFIGRFSHSIIVKYIKYTADDLENYLLDLFEVNLCQALSFNVLILSSMTTTLTIHSGRSTEDKIHARLQNPTTTPLLPLQQPSHFSTIGIPSMYKTHHHTSLLLKKKT